MVFKPPYGHLSSPEDSFLTIHGFSGTMRLRLRRHSSDNKIALWDNWKKIIFFNSETSDIIFIKRDIIIASVKLILRQIAKNGCHAIYSWICYLLRKIKHCMSSISSFFWINFFNNLLCLSEGKKLETRKHPCFGHTSVRPSLASSKIMASVLLCKSLLDTFKPLVI